MLIVSTDAEWVSGLQRFALPTLALLPVETLEQARQQVLDHSPEILLIDLASLGLEDEFLNTSSAPVTSLCATAGDGHHQHRQL